MAGEQYLKIAASNIRRAVQEKQQEIKNLHTYMDSTRNDIERQIGELSSQVSILDASAAGQDPESSNRAVSKLRAHDSRKEIEAKRQEITKVHDESRRQISQLEAEARDLENMARSFEARIG